MNIYMYKLSLVKRLYDDKAWTKSDNQTVNEHFSRLKKDYEAGIVLHVGRTEDPKDDGFGLIVFYANNNETARQYMSNDPAVKGGQMTAVCKSYKLIFNKEI